MYDRQTDSWWQQLTGEALVGELAGTQLDFIPAPIVSWEEFKRAHPEGVVLSRETGFTRPYGFNPYQGYDTGRPWLAEAYRDRRLPAMERVVALGAGEEAVAVPFSFLLINRVATVDVGGEDVVVFHRPRYRVGHGQSGHRRGAGTSARPTSSGPSWTANASPSPRRKRGSWTRRRTASGTCSGRRWTAPWRASRLEQVTHGTHFWFAWSSFQPETRVHGDEP